MHSLREWSKVQNKIPCACVAMLRFFVSALNFEVFTAASYASDGRAARPLLHGRFT